MTLPDHSDLVPDRRLALVEERATIGTVLADRGGVRVAARTETRTETATAVVTDHSVEVTRVPVDRIVEAAEGPRHVTDAEGELTIMPVYEERLIVETRLVLVEEVHVRRRTAPREVQIPVELRRETAEVTRLPAWDAPTRELEGATGMMTDTNVGSSNGSHILTALFDTSAEAERAVERLRRAGIPDASIRVTAGQAADEGTYSDQHRGFWESLGDFFFPDEDRYAYAEGLSRGAQLVTVSGFDSALHDQIVDILDDEGSVDLEARETEWRDTGWKDYRETDYYDADEYGRTHRSGAGLGAGIAAAGSAAVDAAGRAASSVGTAVDSALGGPGSRGTVDDDGVSDRSSYQMAADTAGSAYTGTRVGTDFGRDRATDLDDDETVKIVEERLDVGKREVEGGRVKVRSYVREEPVEADVNLRSTRVFLDRRPVDRALTDGDMAFTDRSIEARESSEEAVVRKEARVVEEIGLREETDVRTEHVSDSVRKTEVEIEDERTGETQRITGDRDRL